MDLPNDPLHNYKPPNAIIWVDSLQKIEQFVPEFRDFLRQPCVRSYPDGSVYVAGRLEALLMHELLKPHALEVRLRENTQFRSLNCFHLPPTPHYALLITDEYFENIGGEENLLVTPTPAVPTEVRTKMPEDDELVGLSYLDSMPPPPGENHPERLLVKVRFWGGLEKAARHRFFRAMVEWADSVSHQGIFGEGPAYLFSESILFNRRVASFQVDVSGSGQNTVNWLTLSVLNFANRGDYVSEIRYGDAENTDD